MRHARPCARRRIRPIRASDKFRYRNQSPSRAREASCLLCFLQSADACKQRRSFQVLGPRHSQGLAFSHVIRTKLRQARLNCPHIFGVAFMLWSRVSLLTSRVVQLWAKIYFKHGLEISQFELRSPPDPPKNLRTPDAARLIELRAFSRILHAPIKPPARIQPHRAAAAYLRGRDRLSRWVDDRFRLAA
jgi:hypothetical protein